jgi:hypothetical protein
MNLQIDTDLDQADEDILTYDVSDEALEAAAGTERGALPESRLWFSVPVAGCCGVAGRWPVARAGKRSGAI